MTNREEARLGYPLFPGDMGPWVRSAVVTGREQVGGSHRKVMCLIRDAGNSACVWIRGMLEKREAEEGEER